MNNQGPDFNAMPIGFALALSQNASAMHQFAMLTEAEQRQVLLNSKQAKTQSEMDIIMNQITYNEFS